MAQMKILWLTAPILKKLEFPAPVTERVAYLIGHHHTYDKIEGMDYQILVEADFLVNINEDGLDSSKQGLDSIRKIKENIFVGERLEDIELPYVSTLEDREIVLKRKQELKY